MGCIPSSCWRTSQQESDVSMQGVVMDEFGRWKSSMEMLEKEARKEAKKDKKRGKIKNKEEDAGSSPVQRAGLAGSYKDLKNMLFRNSGSIPGPGERPSTNGILAGEDGSVSREGSGSSRGLGRIGADSLQSMNSAELMLGIESGAFRKKLLNPPHEKERQDTVDALKVVHTSQSDPHFNSIVSLAAKIFKVPYAAVAIIDRKRVWMKAIHSANERTYEVPRDTSFASFMLLNEKKEVMVVEDTQEDGRFHDLVDGASTEQRIRFLAAAPLYSSNGYQIGALMITDAKPRKMDAGSFTLLTNLAEMVVRALEKEAFGDVVAPGDLPPPAEAARAIDAPSIKAGESLLNVGLISDLAKNNILHHSVSSKKSPAEKLTLVRSVNMLETGIMVCTTTSGGGGAEVLFVNAIWTQLTGIPEKTACSQGLWQLFAVPGREVGAVNKILKDAFAQQKTLELTAKLHSNAAAVFQLSFKSAAADALDQDMPLVGVPSFVEFSQKRNLSYFFVTVRKAKEPQSYPLPTSAFMAAAEGEPWGSQAEEPMEEFALAPASPTANGNSMQRKPSVALPYNDALFSKVMLGPLLGRGSFGAVHRGVWNKRQVAVKVLESFQHGVAGDEVDDLSEASLMEAMRHPNVMVTYKHATRVKYPAGVDMAMDLGGETAHRGYILETWLLLEYCNKGSLQDANDRGWFRTEPSRAKGKPDMGIILPTALEMAQGLSYLHSQGVLHGDLSPGNVLLSDKPDAPHGFTVKIADFGLSRATASKTIKTQTIGTVTHMPPELLMDGRLTKAADVYAYGVLLWGMYTGVPPWQGMRRTQVMFKVTALGATLQIPPNCPPFYKNLLERCMARDHKARPTFDELAKELTVLLEAHQRGSDLNALPAAGLAVPPPVPNGKSKRSSSLQTPPLPEVAESSPLSEAVLKKGDSNNASFKKVPSLQRRPSFSRRVQLEVV